LSQENIVPTKQVFDSRDTFGVHRWTKGRTGPNKITAEARDLARRLLSIPAYRKNFLKRLVSGTLHPMLEKELWHYAWGVPKEQRGGGDEPGRSLLDLLEPEMLKAAYRASLAGPAPELPPGNAPEPRPEGEW
jgi:hypothetical protein